MIGSLRGRLLRIDGVTALIEVNGVGYEVEMPVSSLSKISGTGEVFVYIQQLVREDAVLLYGFHDLASRSLFRELIRVNGVGPKMALAALSTFDVEAFIGTVLHERPAALQQIPGVGRKTAERLIVELRDKLTRFKAAGGEPAPSEPASPGEEQCFEEALSALIALGYKESDAVRYVRAALEQHPALSTEGLIVAALALVSKGKR